MVRVPNRHHPIRISTPGKEALMAYGSKRQAGDPVPSNPSKEALMARYRDGDPNQITFPSATTFNAAKKSLTRSGCTCYWDAYSWSADVKVDCPIHGAADFNGKRGTKTDGVADLPKLGAHRMNVPRTGDCDCTMRAAHTLKCSSTRTGDRTAPPEHYQGTIEPWDYWAAHDLDPWEANAVKYITRAGRKDAVPAVDDYRKARDYLNYLITREENK